MLVCVPQCLEQRREPLLIAWHADIAKPPHTLLSEQSTDHDNPAKCRRTHTFSHNGEQAHAHTHSHIHKHINTHTSRSEAVCFFIHTQSGWWMCSLGWFFSNLTSLEPCAARHGVIAMCVCVWCAVAVVQHAGTNKSTPIRAYSDNDRIHNTLFTVCAKCECAKRLREFSARAICAQLRAHCSRASHVPRFILRILEQLFSRRTS